MTHATTTHTNKSRRAHPAAVRAELRSHKYTDARNLDTAVTRVQWDNITAAKGGGSSGQKRVGTNKV